ncbi:hypothetical protein [Sinomonas susongensis]|uniref:hypothetical protein n=1 Tax=Sinomonas susongensis TaxID=1324851 RepID=UPI001109F7A1|nr:hypothetical protein [Sinomonas susongensis]
MKTKKRTMEHLALIALALITPAQHQESRSALPGAPVVDDGRGRRGSKLASARGWSASILHRAAGALEPPPTSCTTSACVASSTAAS